MVTSCSPQAGMLTSQPWKCCLHRSTGAHGCPPAALSRGNSRPRWSRTQVRPEETGPVRRKGPRGEPASRDSDQGAVHALARRLGRVLGELPGVGQIDEDARDGEVLLLLGHVTKGPGDLGHPGRRAQDQERRAVRFTADKAQPQNKQLLQRCGGQERL